MPPEDALAFFREAVDFRNVRLVEVAQRRLRGRRSRGCWCSRPCRLALFERLAAQRDPVLAAIAAKGVKELTYHRDYAGRWFLTLAQGTEESRSRCGARRGGLLPTSCWPLGRVRRAAGVGVDPPGADEVDVVLEQVFAVSGVERRGPQVGGRWRRSRRPHTEALCRLLAEMQVVARAHPMGQW